MLAKATLLFLVSTVKFFFSPAAGIAWGFSPVQTILITSTGGITGFLFFYYLSRYITQWWKKWKQRKTRTAPTRFSFRNRTIIRIKNSFGLIGIALATPVIISVPIGAVIAARFYPHRKGTLLIMSAGIVFWSVNLTLLLHIFTNYLRN